MADNKYSFIVVKYPDKATGDLAMAAVVGLSKEKLVKLRDAVAITKTDAGKIKLHQTKDDSAKQGFLKGGLIGILFAVLFGPAGWIVAGAALGTAFSMFDRGIKDKLLKELGEKMTSDESGMAVLVEEADWDKVMERMKAHNFMGQIVIKELIPEHATALEQYLDAPPTTEPVPEELAVEPTVEAIVGDAPAASEEAAPAADAAPAAEEAPAEGEEKTE